LAFRWSNNLDFWYSGLPFIWFSGIPDYWNSGIPDQRNSGIQIAQNWVFITILFSTLRRQARPRFVSIVAKTPRANRCIWRMLFFKCGRKKTELALRDGCQTTIFGLLTGLNQMSLMSVSN